MSDPQPAQTPPQQPQWSVMDKGREVIAPPGIEWTPTSAAGKTEAPESVEPPTPPPTQQPVETPEAGETAPPGGPSEPEEPRIATSASRNPASADEITEPVRAAEPAEIAAGPCLQCGGVVGPDGYCDTCGAKAPTVRDHFEESPALWVGGVCDRGVRHHRNEDAMALAAEAEPGSRAVLVVCDGVSTSDDSDVASLAGARAARDLLTEQRPAGMGTPESRDAAMTKTFVEAAKAANDAVIDATAPDALNAASCTFTTAIVTRAAIQHANLGDSRIYWVPDEGEPVALTIDDSVAQVRIELGASREQAETGAQAHAITKWLGRDSEDVVPRTGVLNDPGDGWVLACSDGLWNYASEPLRVAEVLKDALREPGTPTDVARRMVAWANAQGGKDNVTVALARLGDLPPAPEAPAEATAEAEPPQAESPEPEAPPAGPPSDSPFDPSI